MHPALHAFKAANRCLDNASAAAVAEFWCRRDVLIAAEKAHTLDGRFLIDLPRHAAKERLS
jgi:hypothetical protein